MKLVAARLACLALIASLVVAGSARAEEGAERVAPDSCGRAASLEAARQALVRGDRAQALEHLRDAATLLEACARSSDRAEPEQEGVGGEPALAFHSTTSFSPHRS